jgi:hypothetical protein
MVNQRLVVNAIPYAINFLTGCEKKNQGDASAFKEIKK